MTNNVVRWGIAGLGKVAHRFARDLTRHVDNGTLYAVAARDELRANSFAKEHGCKITYSSYQQLAQDTKIDAVYIATIHPFHKDMVELFLKSGKHVLVEKPAFTKVEDWDEMSLLAEERGLLLIEAMKFVAFPAYQELRKFICDNKVSINYIEAAFGNWHEFDVHQQIFNPRLCGGATLDVGVYALWLYVDLCRMTKNRILKPSVRYSQDNVTSEVDENMELIFDGSVKGRICASITRNLNREAIISGPDFKVIIREKWWNPKEIDISYKGKEQKIFFPERGGGFEYEIEHVSSLILDKNSQSAVIPAEISREVISIMESSLAENGFQHLLRG